MIGKASLQRLFMFKKTIIALLGLILISAPLPTWGQDKQVILVHNFTPNPSSQELFTKGIFFTSLKNSLEEKNIAIFSSDLHEYGMRKKKGKFQKYLDKCKAFLTNTEALSAFGSETYFVFWNRPSYLKSSKLKKMPYKKMILFAWEPPSVQPELYGKRTKKCFSKIYTWNDDLVDNKKYFKFFYPVLSSMEKDLPCFEDRKLCTMISGNKTSSYPHELYSERKKAIEFFEKIEGDHFEFFGNGWQASGYKNYKGSAIDKLETLKKYRFSICYENMTEIKGYITEKIFDCFSTGCIPIYWGATNISDYIPKNCFVDRRDFKSYDELYSFIKNLSKEEYEIYVQNIENFLKSPEASLFSKEAFIQTFHASLN